jgi:transposase InsO family protein
MILGWIAEAQQAGARLATACRVVGLTARTIERWRSGAADDLRCGPRTTPKNALTAVEESQVVMVLTSSRYRGLSPKQLVPQLADEGLYLASESTIYRIQRRKGLRRIKRVIERTRIANSTSVHRATGPNQVWSWDITWLPTTVRGQYLHLYLVMDVWSRRIVGWTVATHESAEIAAQLITDICSREQIERRRLVLHSDNGSAMRGRTMVSTLQDLGVIPSFSRPHVADDNPYSESLFRTLKHTPAYPQRSFTGVDEAQRWVTRFVAWYNAEHRHSSIRYVTPDQRHFGADREILAARHRLYQRARSATPARWSGPTRDWSMIDTVELNPERSAA